MFNPRLENELIVSDIVQTMLDYVPIQEDIDETKVKSAANIALKVDIKRIIKQDNLNRCIDPQTEEDENLLELVIPAYCWFTYARLLKHFQGVFTDGGFEIDEGATDKNTAKREASEASSVAEIFLTDVIEFLKTEEEANGVSEGGVDETKMTPSIRVFGGREARASN